MSYLSSQPERFLSKSTSTTILVAFESRSWRIGAV
jgi:hypothetical protein